MKLFSTLTDTNKERAIHMAEHVVLEDLLTEGIHGEPESAEEQERLAEAERAVAHAKTLTSLDEQTEYLFENSVTGELILEKAFQVASTSFYLEEDETAFSLKEMDDHFNKKDETEVKVAEGNSDDEKEFAAFITNAPKKDTKHLN
eukprot:gnl/Spiro4/26684_TR13252_c1_g2_i1.p15 gnl/Spiro4/26684_TR13252_c1_g2~~gnl/Spiro4/26684_TR13252_c1_g2_i1.p15  ORF type:complete len:146 (-),score=8.72 gnl/Spiro4/26684_TR13252_c1_g2_i1:7580-8017(-)